MDFQAIYDQAHKAGHEAATAMVPRPMIVGQAKSLFSNEIDRSKPVEVVADGVCGFAWIHFKGNTPWGRWAKKKGHARADYPSGLCIWVKAYDQSMQRKEAYARAFAKVLVENGISAYANSRLD